jgi:hypothetical protein
MKRSKEFERVKKIIEYHPGLIDYAILDKRTVMVMNTEDINSDEWESTPVVFGNAEFVEIKRLLVEEICTRPKHLDRVEYWECVDIDGNVDMDIMKMLLRKRQKATVKNRKVIKKRALDGLCIELNLDPIMGSTLLSELNLTSDAANEHIRQRARDLDLMS